MYALQYADTDDDVARLLGVSMQAQSAVQGSFLSSQGTLCAYVALMARGVQE